MRAFKSPDTRGFTLVELMIVVAIIGVLAALAIYGVRRHLASAKVAEAKNVLGAIVRGAASAFERESALSELLDEGAFSTATANNLCAAATPVPLVVPLGTKYQPNTASENDYETGSTTAGWRCLKFNLTNAQYYQYNYDNQLTFVTLTGTALGLTAGSNMFEAAAQGDLDGDGIQSVLTLAGQVNTDTQQLVMQTQIGIFNEYE